VGYTETASIGGEKSVGKYDLALGDKVDMKTGLRECGVRLGKKVETIDGVNVGFEVESNGAS
jgi:hypothetical protein